MGVISTIKNYFGFGNQKQNLKRIYSGAKHNRLTSDWVLAPTSGNRELRVSLRALRARARQLARDDDYIKKFLSMCKSNIVGPKGFQLEVKSSTESTDDYSSLISDEVEKEVEEKFKEWSHKENASASMKMSWLDMQRLFVQALAKDGEVLVRKVASDNPFNFAPKFVNVDWLDETYNDILANGNRVLMSAEVDAMDRPVAYWLTPPANEYQYEIRQQDRYRKRYAANEFIHCFLLNEDEQQTRGVTWLHTAIFRLRMLGGYQEAEVVAARVEACKMAYLIPPEEDELAGTTDEENRIRFDDEVSPGQQVELPAGYKVETFDPKHPNPNQHDFVKTVLRGIASGLDISYFSLANDLESVNYSSARVGLLEERDVWRALQQFMIEHFCRPVYQEWLRAAMLSGVLKITLEDFQKVKEPCFRARGWAWVDPLKDTQANIEAINNSLTTHTEILAEQGLDFEDLLRQKRKELDLAESLGVSLQSVPQQPAKVPSEKEGEG